jgi:hypothetical protein
MALLCINGLKPKLKHKMLRGDCEAALVVFEDLKRARDHCYPPFFIGRGEPLETFELKHPGEDYRGKFLYNRLEVFLIARKRTDHFENTYGVLGQTLSLSFDEAFELTKTAMKKDLVVANAELKLAKN